MYVPSFVEISRGYVYIFFCYNIVNEYYDSMQGCLWWYGPFFLTQIKQYSITIYIAIRTSWPHTPELPITNEIISSGYFFLFCSARLAICLTQKKPASICPNKSYQHCMGCSGPINILSHPHGHWSWRVWYGSRLSVCIKAHVGLPNNNYIITLEHALQLLYSWYNYSRVPLKFFKKLSKPLKWGCLCKTPNFLKWNTFMLFQVPLAISFDIARLDMTIWSNYY